MTEYEHLVATARDGGLAEFTAPQLRSSRNLVAALRSAPSLWPAAREILEWPEAEAMRQLNALLDAIDELLGPRGPRDAA